MIEFGRCCACGPGGPGGAACLRLALRCCLVGPHQNDSTDDLQETS